VKCGLPKEFLRDESPSHPRLNKFIYRKVEDSVPCDLYCVQHGEFITGYIEETERYFCSSCVKPKHGETFVPITGDTINSAVHKLYTLLEAKKRVIDRKLKEIGRFY
jgi:hypothetical protein